MANLLEESRNLMPGKGRSHWSMNESSLDWKSAAKKLLAKRTGKRQHDLHYRAYLRAIISGDTAQATHMVQNFPAAKKARAELIDLAGMGEGMEEGTHTPSDLAALAKKAEGKIDAKVRVSESSFTAKRGGCTVTVSLAKGKGQRGVLVTCGKKAVRLGAKGELTRLADNVAATVNRMLRASTESVAGAPGAFAISDAEPPSLEAMKADLIDRCRNPRWEYPAWALPKVQLDEDDE